ncbi:MAG TPA: A24 family peptidase [Sphingomonas sp.]|uniref:prepilin peptidase n=1 Tax=Sphingomonas sp. TaxID=28214 RepID=UPI002EDB2A90
MFFAQQSGWQFPLFAGLVGLVIGSFLATVALRWPAGRSVATGRSACDQCGRTLRWWELLPLLSWLALGGRCGRCGGAIDVRHPAVEAAAGLLALLLSVLLPPPAALAGMGLGWTLLLLTLLDLDHYWLPDRLTVPLLAAGLAVGAIGIGPAWPDRAIGAAAGWGTLALVAWGYRRWRGRTGLGGGDPKLFGAIGAWVGWAMLPMVLLIASLCGIALVLGAATLGRRMTATTRIPFGPMLALAGLVGWIGVAG